ncbi:hypothetical protein [Clostridium botulinum]|uniref:hypothetical protein n=1 Tax=Clostridium botulinum TaxID=1491 RepID=UPI003DA28395
MKKILIVRSANMVTMDKLIMYIIHNNNDYKIYCLIQESSITSFKNSYPYINFIKKEDGFFNYENFKDNKELISQLNDIYFDEIYIPSSTVDFSNFQETFMIVSKIKANRNILFNCYGEIHKQNLKFYSLWFDKYFNNIVYFIKVFFALLGIAVLYLISYPYYLVKNKLKELNN